MRLAAWAAWAGASRCCSSGQCGDSSGAAPSPRSLFRRCCPASPTNALSGGPRFTMDSKTDSGVYPAEGPRTSEDGLWAGVVPVAACWVSSAWSTRRCRLRRIRASRPCSLPALRASLRLRSCKSAGRPAGCGRSVSARSTSRSTTRPAPLREKAAAENGLSAGCERLAGSSCWSTTTGFSASRWLASLPRRCATNTESVWNRLFSFSSHLMNLWSLSPNRSRWVTYCHTASSTSSSLGSARNCGSMSLSFEDTSQYLNLCALPLLLSVPRRNRNTRHAVT
mmetsp:Transcript_16560/g.22796  ORF Transcript_16560/g.22796 Transcript_16560/m.22796 type:complete len:281 (-) Transcript_16560:392-1234(-)